MIAAADVPAILARAEADQVRPDEVLLKMQLVDPADLTKAQATFAGIPWADELDIDEIDVELSEPIPVSFARQKGCLTAPRRGWQRCHCCERSA